MKIKMKKSALTALKGKIHASLAARITKGERKTTPDPSVVVTKNEYVSITKYLRGLYLGKWDGAENEQRIHKALNSTIGTQGGFLVPEEMSSEIIELVRAKTVVRSMPGVRVRPMSRDTWSQRRTDTGPTVSWGAGQNASISEDTAMTFGKVSLQLKKMVCLYKASRELIHDADVSADGIVMTELAEAIAIAEDAAFLHGTGGDQPLGLYNNPRITWTRLDSAVTFDDIMGMAYNLEKNNRQLTGLIVNPREKHTLRKLKNGDGSYYWREGKLDNTNGVLQMNTLYGVPVADTTTVPLTGHSGSNENYILGGQWTDFIIGDSTEGLRMETTQDGGDAFQYDQLWIKAVKRVDCTVRHPESFVRLQDVTT